MKLIKKNTLNHEMKICFFQIFKSSFSQPFLAITSSFSIPSNQYCFVISLNSTFSWFSRNPPHNIIVVLRSKQTLFLHLTTTFVPKITYNKAGIIVPCILRLGWPRNLSPVETLVSKLRRPPNCFEDPIVSLQLLGLTTKAEVQNKQQLGWFLKSRSQVSFIFHFLCFSNKWH